MAPPPVTPSPHRFVIKKEHPPPRSTPLAQEHTTPRPSTQQFNATPRFTFSSTPHPPASQILPRITPSAARYLTPARKTSRHHDAIEEPSSSDGQQAVQESIDTEEQDVDLGGYDSGELEDDLKFEEPNPKRRRLSTPPVAESEGGVADDQEKDVSYEENFEASSSLPILSSPPAPRRPILVTSTTPRFLVSTPAPQSTPRADALTPNPTPFLKPPRFRPPDPSEASQTQSDPLPEQFSPHRRGQKYVAGGLAAEVRDWLMNLDGSISNTRETKSEDDDWLVKIMVHEVSGSSRDAMTLIRGRQIRVLEHNGNGHGGEMADTVGQVRVMLAGEGAGRGLQKGSRVEIGKTVGIKGPLWEVVVEGEKWGVGVDWKVLG